MGTTYHLRTFARYVPLHLHAMSCRLGPFPGSIRLFILLTIAVLNEELEGRGAYIEGGAALEYVSMGFSCLAEDAPDVLGLFSEVVLTPALPQGKLDLYKAQVSVLAESSFVIRQQDETLCCVAYIFLWWQV